MKNITRDNKGKKWDNLSPVYLKGFKPYNGKHCESSAMLNMFQHEGYDLSEKQIIGSGAILGFVYELNKFPFLGGRTLEFKEHAFKHLEINWHSGSNDNYGFGWNKLHSVLKEGHPVVLRVDMRFLPYLYNGKYGPKYMSFGWHLICLTGIDTINKTATVTDTEKKTIQTIKLSDLHKARFSNTKVLPPNGEFYWVEQTPANFDVNHEKIALKSLKVTAEAMTEAKSEQKFLAGLDGLSKLPETLMHLDSIVPSFLLSNVLYFNYGSIETNGTGGSAFRKLFYQYLEDTAQKSGNKIIKQASALCKKSAESWTILAQNMKDLGNRKSVLKNKQERQSAFIKTSESAQEVYKAEKAFYEYILKTVN